MFARTCLLHAQIPTVPVFHGTFLFRWLSIPDHWWFAYSLLIEACSCVLHLRHLDSISMPVNIYLAYSLVNKRQYIIDIWHGIAAVPRIAWYATLRTVQHMYNRKRPSHLTPAYMACLLFFSAGLSRKREWKSQRSWAGAKLASYQCELNLRTKRWEASTFPFPFFFLFFFSLSRP